MRAFDRSTLAIDSREIATRYPDGSYYAIFLLQPTTGPGKRRNRTVTIELFGLPGSGKTTLARSALKAGRVEYSDGYASMGELSVWGCVRRRPLAAIRLLIRLLACGREAMRPPAKEVIVTALRQGVAASTAGSPICVFEEGTCHEAWRQLVQGHRLSRRLLQAIIPAADLTIILDPPVELVKERLSAKPHPGPISRELIGQDLGSELWDSALVAFKAIQETIRTGKTESLRFNNDGDAEAGRVRFERITLDFSRQTVNPSV